MAEKKKSTNNEVAKNTAQNAGADLVVEEHANIPSVIKDVSEEAREEEKKFSATEVEAIVAMAVAQALKERDGTKQDRAPQVLHVKPDETVTLLYMGAIAEGTTVSLGVIGEINGDGGTLDVPKTEFLRNINSAVRTMLKKRNLIVVDGLSDEERDRYHVAYKPGEVLTEKMFFHILDYSKEEIVRIFKLLCVDHKRLVARLFITAFEHNDNRVALETVTELNAISKKDDPKGMFAPILKAMGKEIAQS